MNTKLFIKDGVSLLANYFKKTQRTAKIGDIEICSIFRGNRHIGSKVKYPNGVSAETSISNRFTLTQEGEFAPMRVYKTTTTLPDGTKIVEKNKLARVGQNVEIQNTTTTSTSSTRQVKKTAAQETPPVVPPAPETPKANPVKTKIKEPANTNKPVNQNPKSSGGAKTFLGIRNDEDITGFALAFTYLVLIPACVGAFWWIIDKLAELSKPNYDFSSQPNKSAEKAETKKTAEKKQELIEYIPKRGENWSSILKAKYGVNDVTAKAMAHRIKDMCYDDSLASKQAPIMYLPKVWEFNGTTYHYNDSVDAGRCKKFSDKVKTEMGKMSRDLQY